jgi:hypothetical protein
MIHCSLAILLALVRRGDAAGAGVRSWILELERKKRWAAERAIIRAEIARAKDTVDLIRMARAFTKLNSLEAEIEAVGKNAAANRH